MKTREHSPELPLLRVSVAPPVGGGVAFRRRRVPLVRHASHAFHRAVHVLFEEFNLRRPRRAFARVQDVGFVKARAEPGHEPLDHVEAEELAALVLGLREGDGWVVVVVVMGRKVRFLVAR